MNDPRKSKTNWKALKRDLERIAKPEREHEIIARVLARIERESFRSEEGEA